MLKQRIGLAIGAAVAVASLVVFSGCGGGGGGGTPPAGGTLTGTSAVSSSAVSRVGRGSVASISSIKQSVRPRQSSQPITSRSRQALEFDEEYGLYYRLRMNPEGARIEFFEDSAGQRHAGDILYRETRSSYEIIVDIKKGLQPQQAYFKLAETGRPDRIHLIARYKDLKTDERSSVEGDLVVRGAARSRQDDEDDDPYDWEDDFDWGDWGGDEDDWYDDYDWWDDWDETGDEYFGDNYFEDDFFSDEDFFSWDEESETEDYDDIGDFEIVRFEGEMTYEGCGKEVTISNAQLDFITGRLTGTIQVDGASGSIDYNYETEQGQIVLNTANGQVTIRFNGDVIEARYPDGRIERVNASQWADPCQGVGGGDNNQGGGGNQDGGGGDNNQGGGGGDNNQGGGGGGNQDGGGGDGNQGNLSLSSTAFANNGTLPLRYASTDAGGQNVSPPLSWSGAPSGTRSFVLVCLDPDADNFVHWVMYDIPASVSSLLEGVPPQATLPNGAKQGENDMGTIGYFGPEPPPGELHRYVFTLYALAVDSLGLEPGASYRRVKEALDNLRSQNKVLGEVQLVGKFQAN
jgi:Raf kinase inhibitor-like YbhB/YbcL family protein